MGLRPTQGDEKSLGPATTLYGTDTLSLSSRAKPRDLRFRGPFVEMFFDRAQRRLRKRVDFDLAQAQKRTSAFKLPRSTRRRLRAWRFCAAQHVVERLRLGQLRILFCHRNGEDADFVVVG
jgi:hypothetical protein